MVKPGDWFAGRGIFTGKPAANTAFLLEEDFTPVLRHVQHVCGGRDHRASISECAIGAATARLGAKECAALHERQNVAQGSTLRAAGERPTGGCREIPCDLRPIVTQWDSD